MARNPDRRRALADAGLRVLAESGARGLTHRAVDTEAGVPLGTASNYFRSRDALLGALGERIMERFAPDEAVIAELAARAPSRELFIDYMRYIVERTTRQPELTRALIELRLEAARRPGLAASLGQTLRRGYRDDVAYHATTGLAERAVRDRATALRAGRVAARHADDLDRGGHGSGHRGGHLRGPAGVRRPARER
nr:hypothetical protein GCM10020092_077690 [Actinoplanes digitatis]